MESLKNGVVLSDALYAEYYKFTSGGDYSKDIINKIMAFRFDGFVTNVRQCKAAGNPISAAYETALRSCGMDNQSCVELSRNFTVYKIVLTNDPAKKGFPYVNIDSQDEKISLTLSGSFKISEKRTKAVEHISALCMGAKKLFMYDAHLNASDKGYFGRVAADLNKIIPTTKVEVKYCVMDQKIIKYLREESACRTFVHTPIPVHHDRYIIVDDRLEIIISSGFDHLTLDNRRELTYIVRNIKKTTSTLGYR